MADLLKAAGMPLDLERQELLQQSLAMQQQVKDAQEELAKQAQVSPLMSSAPTCCADKCSCTFVGLIVLCSKRLLHPNVLQRRCTVCTHVQNR